ncbi:DndE family protein [uncultured Thiodictyon sp.]|uniref:DndE family protein n=1 Tax=uncultured Thiodictyon sp. TaxID=1846217 RepID=UPI0025DFF6C3|nr:DndE family protein [uncultured Thiodictyon sp.]
MADRLYTLSEADEVLSALRFETKLEKATLARIAFTLSLVKDGATVAPSTSFSGGEMKRPTFFGEDEAFIRALIARKRPANYRLDGPAWRSCGFSA